MSFHTTVRQSSCRIANISTTLSARLESIETQLSVFCKTSSARCSRAFSSHASTSSSSSTRTLRRVNVSNETAAAGDAAAAAAADAGASTSGQTASLLEMSTEVPGGSKPLRSWEKYYWGVGVVGVSGLLYWNLKKPEKTPEEIEAAKQRAAELEQRRKEHLRAVLMGQNFIEGESDPLDGLSPAQIVKFMDTHGIDPTDPLEGLTPEEIDAYVQKQEAARQAQ